MKIGLVACCKSKLDRPAAAREIYTSNLFRLSLLEAERQCDVVYVISAKHGLVELDQVIAPYEKTMADHCKEWKVIWGLRVWMSIVSRHPAGGRHIEFYAATEYVKPIRHAAHRAPAVDTLTEPMARMQIGQRLSWLKMRGAIPTTLDGFMGFDQVAA